MEERGENALTSRGEREEESKCNGNANRDKE